MTKDPVRDALHQLLDKRDLDEATAAHAIGTMMDGVSDPALVAAFLTAMRLKGETVEELVGAARAMRERATGISAGVNGLLDTCGTGGDGLATFNISTAAAIVAAAAGVPVAKHGNRAASSTSGSADVLEALGVRIDLSPEQVSLCVREVGIGFCFAPLCHGAMKNVAPIRKQLGFRTLFNLLGPLTNPAGAGYQLVGAGQIDTARLLAQALARLDVDRAVVVCGNNELDEVSLWGKTTVFLVEGDQIQESEWDASKLTSHDNVRVETLRVTSPEESAAMIRRVLENEPSSAREIVIANAAAALLAARRVDEIEQGLTIAADLLATGAARDLLERLIHQTQQLTQPQVPA